VVRCGLFRRSGSGVACSGVARSGVEWLGEAVEVRSAQVWFGQARHGGCGLERLGKVR